MSVCYSGVVDCVALVVVMWVALALRMGSLCGLLLVCVFGFLGGCVFVWVALVVVMWVAPALRVGSLCGLLLVCVFGCLGGCVFVLGCVSVLWFGACFGDTFVL